MQAIHRLAAGAACVPLLQCSRLAASPTAADCVHASHRCISGASRAPPAVCARDWPRAEPRRHLPPAAAYTVVSSGGSGDGSSSGSSQQPDATAALRLIVYSKEGCHLCEGLKEKLEALLERAAFLPSPLSGAELEVRDIATNPDWEQRYALTIPVLAVVGAGAAAQDGGSTDEEVTVPRPSPRFTADALQKHIERFLAAQQQQQQQQD